MSLEAAAGKKLEEEWRHVTIVPNGWINEFRLLSPWAWWRVSAFKHVRWFRPLLTSVAAALMPLSCLPFLVDKDKTRSFSSNGISSTIRAAASNQLGIVLACCSTCWTVAWTYKAFGAVRNSLGAIRDVLNGQSQTKACAYQCLAERIQQKLAYRTRLYDVYLPSGMKPQSPHTQTAAFEMKDVPQGKQKAILFFPGAMISHTSYAETASVLADRSQCYVVVVNSDPWRLIDIWLPGFSIRNIRSIQSRVEQTHNDIDGWIALMGHSMGSFFCTKLAEPLGIPKIVMLAAAPFCDYMKDISSSEMDIQVLVVQAGQDNIINMFATPELTRQFWKLLPEATTTVKTIANGTHSGFASYIPAFAPEVDTILPVPEQQAQAVEWTVDFLLSQSR